MAIITTMKRLTLILLATIFLLLAPVFVVKADDNSPRGLGIKQEAKASAEARRAEKTEEFRQRRQERISEHFQTMTDRFQAAIERLNKLVTRIEERIAKIESEDPEKNLDNINVQVDEAKQMLEEAQNKLADMVTNFNDFLTNEEPKAAFKQLGVDVRGLKSDLMKIHKQLVHVIGDIKGLRVGDNNSEE